MNPRRIFWILFSAAALWFLLGTRIFAYQNPAIDDPAPKFLQRIHIGLGNIVNGTLMPVTYVGTLVQTQISRLAPSADFAHVSADVADDKDVLLRRLQEAEAENERIRTRINNFEDFKSTFGLNPKEFLILAKRVGGPTSMNADTCTINVGSEAGVRIGMPVLCKMAVVGQVVQVGTVNSVVRLTTDPTMKIGAVIKRGAGPQQRVIARCVMIGQGQGLMICTSIPKTNSASREIIIPPQPGDRLYIDDPARFVDPLQGKEFGVITEVRDNGTLHYSIKARPSEDLISPRSTAAKPDEAYDGLRVFKVVKQVEK